MIAYWNNLNEREKVMVFAAVLCSVAFIYYSLLYSPLTTGVTEKTQMMQEKVSTLEWMKKVQTKKDTLRAKKTIDNSQLLTLLTTQLKNHSALQFPYQVQQTSSGEIQISFEKVPFNLFMEWLAQLDALYYINIKQMSVNKTATPGVTQLMISISAVP